MTNTIRIKRRAAGGAPGAPAGLENAEIAFNEQDDILYYGKGAGGAGGTATQIIPIGGLGAFTAKAHDGAGGSAHANAVASGNSGFMTGADKAKLDGVAVNATNYTHPTNHPPSIITQDSSNRFVTDAEKATWSAKQPAGTYATGTGTASGTNTGDQVIPTTLPASDVYAWAKATIKPVYTPAEVGAMATTHAANSITGFGAAATSLGTSTAGISTTLSRSDHVHQLPLLSGLGLPTAAVNLNNQKITNLSDPTLPTDAATMNYVDLAVQGLDAKQSVRVATTTNITLSAPQTIDGIAVIAGDRVLVKNQTTAGTNGVYVVNAGVWTRALDLSTWGEHTSAFIFVEDGSSNANSGWLCTVLSSGTLGSTAITWTQFSGAGQITAGNGLTKTGNTLDVGTASTGRIVVNADNIDLASGIVTAGTYKSVTVDTYGRVTAGSNPTTLTGYGITDALSKSDIIDCGTF